MKSLFFISCARACTVASDVLLRHSLLLIANYTSEPVCFLRDTAIFGNTIVFFEKIFYSGSRRRTICTAYANIHLFLKILSKQTSGQFSL